MRNKSSKALREDDSLEISALFAVGHYYYDKGKICSVGSDNILYVSNTKGKGANKNVAQEGQFFISSRMRFL